MKNVVEFRVREPGLCLGRSGLKVELLYVAMNGRALPWDRVRKNRKTGVFEEIEP